MIKAVLFDFDETLQDRTKAFDKYMDAFLNNYRPKLTNKQFIQCEKDMVDTGNGGYVDRVEWFTKLIKMWDWQNSPTPEELADDYDKKFGDFNVIYSNSVPLLKELKKLGYIVGVVTNGPSGLQNHKMDTSGLRPYCDIVIVSGDVGIHKPNPELFTFVANKLNLKTSECVYVGDHPINDIKGSLESGMKAIRMNTGWFKDEELRDDVPVIDDIIEVLPTLANMQK